MRDLVLGWAEELPAEFERCGQPFELALVEEAVALCRDLADPAEPAVLANRDFHLRNVLAAQREPWLAIDPKPLAGERAFDTGHLLRTLLPDRLGPADAHRLVGLLAAELDLEPERVRAWAFLRSVDDALWMLTVGRDRALLVPDLTALRGELDRGSYPLCHSDALAARVVGSRYAWTTGRPVKRVTPSTTAATRSSS